MGESQCEWGFPFGLEQGLIKSGNFPIWVNEVPGEQVQATECQSRGPLIITKYKDQKL